MTRQWLDGMTPIVIVVAGALVVVLVLAVVDVRSRPRCSAVVVIWRSRLRRWRRALPARSPAPPGRRPGGRR